MAGTIDANLAENISLALSAIIRHSSNTDVARLANSLEDLEKCEPVSYRSLRGQVFMRAIIEEVHEQIGKRDQPARKPAPDWVNQAKDFMQTDAERFGWK